MFAGSRRRPGPSVTCHIRPDDSGRHPRDNAPVRNLPTDHRAGGHHHVPPDAGAGKHDDTSAEPAPGSDRNRTVAGPLPPDRRVRVGVPMVLVGDVHIWAGEHIVADHDRVMRHDVAAAADDAPVADPQQRVLPQVLAGNHARAESDLGADHGAGAQRDPALPIQGTRREADHRARTEPGERPPAGGVGGDRPRLAGRPPQPVHQPPGKRPPPPGNDAPQAGARRGSIRGGHDRQRYRATGPTAPVSPAAGPGRRPGVRGARR